MKKKKSKSNEYFDAFPKLAHHALEIGEMIFAFMQNFDPKGLEELKEKAHAIEHEADEEKHLITEKLFTEFMTPIDREDIFHLLTLIDDVTDATEEISQKLYGYDYGSLPPDTLPFMSLTMETLKATEECLSAFPDYLDPLVMGPLIEKVAKLEEESDEEYSRDLHSLYLTEKDGFVRHKSEAMYSMLETVGDHCLEVARCVQNIAFKNL